MKAFLGHLFFNVSQSKYRMSFYNKIKSMFQLRNENFIENALFWF